MLQTTTNEITIDLSKQQALDADPKVIIQINFTGNMARAGNKTTFFAITEVKKLFWISYKKP